MNFTRPNMLSKNESKIFLILGEKITFTGSRKANRGESFPFRGEKRFLKKEFGS